MNSINFRQKELRNEKSLTQAQLANILNVSQKSISNWEIGYREPDYDTLKKAANYFSVTIDYLLGLTD